MKIVLSAALTHIYDARVDILTQILGRLRERKAGVDCGRVGRNKVVFLLTSFLLTCPTFGWYMEALSGLHVLRKNMTDFGVKCLDTFWTQF